MTDTGQLPPGTDENAANERRAAWLAQHEGHTLSHSLCWTCWCRGVVADRPQVTEP